MKKRLLASLAGILGIALTASGALAAPWISDTVAGTSYVKHYIAYEVYNNATGINADQVPFFVHTNAPLTTGASINVQATNANINMAAGQLFIAVDGAAFAAVPACTAAPAAGTWYPIGESSSAGVPVPSVSTIIYDEATFCTRNNLGGGTVGTAINIPAGRVVSTEQGTVNTLTNIATTTVKEALNLSVLPNLNPTCTYQPLVSLAYVTNQEVAGPTAVLQIVPQIIGSTNVNALSATLDTDFDFKRFIFPGSATEPNVSSITTITSSIGGVPPNTPVVRLINQQTEGIAGNILFANLFDAFKATTATTSLSFSLTSAAAEPGVGISYNGVPLTNVGNVWSITASGDVLANITNALSRPLVVANNTTFEMNPTTWNLSTFALTLDGTPTCVIFNNPEVGAWAGGLEAYVPFVKSNSSYSTFIKLSNRYSKAAKVYVAAMNPNTNSTITSTQQLATCAAVIPSSGNCEAIPTNGQITISGQDLVDNGIITADMANQGTPVKFLIRVPTQAYTATNDGYITGIVVQTTPAGQQRAVNLEFKWFKNGGLVAN